MSAPYDQIYSVYISLTVSLSYKACTTRMDGCKTSFITFRRKCRCDILIGTEHFENNWCYIPVMFGSCCRFILVAYAFFPLNIPPVFLFVALQHWTGETCGLQTGSMTSVMRFKKMTLIQGGRRGPTSADETKYYFIMIQILFASLPGINSWRISKPPWQECTCASF